MKSNNNIVIYVYPKEHPQPSKQRLRSCAKEFASDMGLSFREDAALCREKQGKPYFKGTEVCFSISHSKDYWVCAFGSAPLGVDLQDHRICKKEAIALRYFHPAEQEYLIRGGYKDFFSVWAAKESYVKYTGLGISGQFSRFSVVDPEGRWQAVGQTSFRFVPFLEDYTLCVCGENLGNVQLILR